MILDGHIHIRKKEITPDALRQKLSAVGVSGGVLISLPPPCFSGAASGRAPDERLDGVLAWCKDDPNLYPFFWIDPMEAQAEAQVASAVDRGAMGFKVICGHHHPGDDRAMPVYQAIADSGKPILFHSGILWDGKPSSPFNRPAGFESLLTIRGLKFCLAHISWPWCDELIAVYGKFQNAGTGGKKLSVEMWVDITPGTPPIYRREALTRLFTAGYDVEHNVIFGSDCSADDYNGKWTREWIDRDREIFQGAGLSEETVDGVLCENLRRFVGVSERKVQKASLRPAE